MSDASERKRILIVDDEPVNIEILSELLRHNYVTVAAKGGEAALKRIASGPQPDLVLLDVMMPDMDGHEVCRRIKTHERTRNIPVIFVTTVTEAEDEAKGLDLGAVDYISKPISPAVVLARVRSHLALQDARRDMECQRDFIRRVFGRYMGENMVDLVLATPEGLRLGGEKRKASILMCDLRNFTSLAEVTGPEQVVQVLNGFLSEMVAVAERHDGTIDNFMGDSVLVVFGSPIRRDDDAQRAIACAIAMQRAMPAMNARHQAQGLPILSMGIGINTGEVVVGNIGSDRHMKYSVIGSTVNLTARLQAMAVGGQVLVSASSFAEIGAEATVNGHLWVNLKGFGMPIEVYDIVGLPVFNTVV